MAQLAVDRGTMKVKPHSMHLNYKCVTFGNANLNSTYANKIYGDIESTSGSQYHKIYVDQFSFESNVELYFERTLSNNNQTQCKSWLVLYANLVLVAAAIKINKLVSQMTNSLHCQSIPYAVGQIRNDMFIYVSSPWINFYLSLLSEATISEANEQNTFLFRNANYEIKYLPSGKVNLLNGLYCSRSLKLKIGHFYMHGMCFTAIEKIYCQTAALFLTICVRQVYSPIQASQTVSLYLFFAMEYIHILP